jgi:neutral ceramidase
MCIARGPGKDMFESTEIIGRNQYEHGMALFRDTKSSRLKGDVAFRHSFIDMSNRNVTLANGDVVTTCPAALGYSFAAGTTDGPGE